MGVSVVGLYLDEPAQKLQLKQAPRRMDDDGREL